MSSKGQGQVFRDPAKRAEMIELRKMGFSYIEIGKKYGVDHTTIIYHCRKEKMLIFIDDNKRAEMLQMVRVLMDIPAVALHYGVPSTLIEYYCGRAGIKGFLRTPRPPGLAADPQIHIPPGGVPEIVAEERRPGWRLDERGEWICVGHTVAERRQEEVLKKKRDLDKKRSALLTY